MVYEPASKAGIYIQTTYTTNISGEILSYKDSTTVSFTTLASNYKETTTYFTVKLLGDTVGYDRPFKITVDEQSTAVRGTHFEIDDADCVIPAGKAEKRVPVKLLRHADLLKKAYRLVLNLEANDYFDLEMQKYKSTAQWNATGTTLSGTQYKIIFSELYTAPSYWSYYGTTYFGTWSALKEQKINELMGWLHSDWNYAGYSGYPVQLGKFAYAARKLREQLQAAADEGNPVKEDNGSYMQLGTEYSVDYSKYEH